MYSIAFLALLAGCEYASVQAAHVPLGRRQSDTPVPLWGACNYPSQGINGPLPCADGAQCICKDDTYAQCRTQVDGSWTPSGSPWQCQAPGDTATGSTSGTSSSTGDQPSTSSTVPSSGGGDVVASGTTSGGATTDEGKKSEAQVGGAQNNAVQLVPAAASSAPAASSGSGSSGSGDTSSAPSGGSSAATVGTCDSTSPAAGYDGVASTSYYGWMGSACDCGQSSWQWSGGAGLYNAAVNQKLFDGTLNSAGQPNCGSACGQCYELSTSGVNTYNDGVGSGSTITVQIVDACYSAGDHWCGSTSDDYKDSSDCGVHFDIQTGAPGTNGQAAVGSDGRVWNDGGQIVNYKPVACPGSLSSNYGTCTC